jgi:PhzF family phenazine biosynthesis protein
MTTPRVHLVSVFASGPNGGNPAPIVADAAGMSDEDMQAVARASGHESGFVLPAPPGSDCDFGSRFWVPNHEMEMCGHATVGPGPDRRAIPRQLAQPMEQPYGR